MGKKTVLGFSFVAVASFVGFALGFGIGQSTRRAAPSHVETDFSSGVFTIKADVTGALSQGIGNYFGL